MSSIQKIFLHPACPHCHKVLAAAEFVGKTAEIVFVSWEDIKKPEFLSVNPTGKVPAVITPEGPLSESHAILRALARSVPDKGLYGKTNFEKAKVDQWLDFVSGEIVSSSTPLVYAIIGRSSIDEKAYETQLQTAKTKLKILDEHLNGKKFLVGDSITIADISLISCIRFVVAVAFDAEVRKEFPHFFAYFDAITALPEITKSLGRSRKCEKRWPLYQAPVVQKEEKKTAEKKEQPKKKKEEEEEEVEAPKKDDAKSELENLPASKFNFFDFKTLIVNAPDKKEAMKAFWEQFDKEGYSLWFVEYEKAEGEGKVVYLTNNLMNGFLQRLDHFRKYTFAVYGVYGDEPNLEVRGIFCWRGTGVPLMIKEHDQYDYHKFTKLDSESETDRKRVEEYWTKLNEDEDVVEGLTARTVKYFK